MNTTQRLLLAAGALVGTSLFAAAFSQLNEQPRIWMCDTLVGSKIFDTSGTTVGELEDIVVDPRQHSSYAIISLGDWANMAERLHAMPFATLRTVEADPKIKDSERRLVLNIDKELLRKAPDFPKDTWPDMTTANWSRDIDAFYRANAVADGSGARPTSREGRDDNTPRPIEAAAGAKIILWKASDLDGADVQNTAKEKLGDIEHIAVDSNGRFCYVTISVGGFLGIGERQVAVPWEALQFSTTGEKNEKRVITLPCTKELLGRAPEYDNDEDERARMASPEWIKTVYDHFSVAPYWSERDALTLPGTAKN